MTKTAKLAFPLLLLLALVAGCGDSGDKTVATVGDYDITLTEFKDFISRVNIPFGSAQEDFDHKRKLLDTIITKRLLIQAAYEMGIDEVEDVARVVLANKDQFLLDILYQRVVADKAKEIVTETQMKRYWEMLEYRIQFSHILVEDGDTAQMLVEKLMAGENFEQIAYDYSIDPSAKRNRGDLGYNTWGALVDEFQEAGFQMEVGEISPPVKSQFGYHIIRVVDKQLNETRTEYEVSKPMLERIILDRSKMKIMAEFMEGIQETYAVTVDSAIGQYVMHKREELYPPAVLENLPRSDFDIEQLDRNERELVLATWNGGQITLFEYLTDIRPLRADLRPDLDDVDSLQTIIFNLKRNDFLILEAIRLGYETDPEFKRKMKLYKEWNMAEIMQNDSLPTQPVPDEAAIRKHYENNIEIYSDPAEIQVFEILLSDEMMANNLAKEIKTLEEFREKAMDLTERPAKRASNGDLGYIQRRWFPEIFDAADKMPVGQIGGPVVTSDNKYSVFWVTDKIPAVPKAYLDIKGEIIRKLAAEQKAEALRLWVEAREEVTSIEINEEALWETVDKSQYASNEG